MTDLPSSPKKFHFILSFLNNRPVLPKESGHLSTDSLYSALHSFLGFFFQSFPSSLPGISISEDLNFSLILDETDRRPGTEQSDSLKELENIFPVSLSVHRFHPDDEEQLDLDLKQFLQNSSAEQFIWLNAGKVPLTDLSDLWSGHDFSFNLGLTYNRSNDSGMSENAKITLYIDLNDSGEIIYLNTHEHPCKESYEWNESCFFTKDFLLALQGPLFPIKQNLSTLWREHADHAALVFGGIPMGGPFLDLYRPRPYHFPARRPCLFLDRDGVIIKDKKYLSSLEEIEIIEEIIPLMQWARERNFLIIVLTNQSIIGRSQLSEERHQIITQRINELLEERGQKIDQWYFSPYHPTHGQGPYLRDSLCRKPRPGMVLKAMNDFAIDLKKSLMVGDKVSDILQLKGLKTFLIQGDYSLKHRPPLTPTFNNLTQLLEHLKANDA